MLRKTNSRDQTFSLNLIVNDREIRQRDHSVYEPIRFYLDGARVPYEVIITAVGSSSVVGSVRIPKSADQQKTPGPRT